MTEDARSKLRKAAGGPPSHLDVGAVVTRGQRAARWRRLQFGLVIFVLFVGSVAGAAFLSSRESSKGSQVPAEGAEPPENDQDLFTTDPSSNEFRFEGAQEGRSWDLRVVVSRLTEKDSGDSYFAPCLGLGYASVAEPGSTCLAGRENAVNDADGAPFIPLEHQGTGGLDDGDNAYFGIAPTETDSVLVRHEDGAIDHARMLDTNSSEANFRVFIAFAPGKGLVEVLAKSADGQTLGSETFTDGF